MQDNKVQESYHRKVSRLSEADAKNNGVAKKVADYG
jgi:hypothetical protein